MQVVIERFVAFAGDENAGCAPAQCKQGEARAMQERRCSGQIDRISRHFLQPPMTLDERIAEGQRHVDRGRRIIERQRALVARHPWASAVNVLRCFTQTQEIFEAELAALLKRR